MDFWGLLIKFFTPPDPGILMAIGWRIGCHRIGIGWDAVQLRWNRCRSMQIWDRNIRETELNRIHP
jgi:hypothetical protein